MKKKSYLALFLAVLMALSVFTGCDSKEPETGTLTPIIEDPTEAPTDTEAPADVPAETPVTEDPAQSDVSLGRMEGGKYTNSYTGYGCTLDSSWVFYSAEELQELPENTQEMFSESELGEAMANYPQITDMMAENTSALTTINVLYTQIPVKEQLGYAILTEEESIDYALRQKDLMIGSYEQAGILVSSMEKAYVSFLGEDRVAIKTVASINGVPYYILQIQDYQLGPYGVTLTLSSFQEDHTESLLELFYPVD